MTISAAADTLLLAWTGRGIDSLIMGNGADGNGPGPDDSGN